MADIVRLAREHGDVSADQLDRMRDLVADWSLIADLAFGDLVLWVPTWNGGGYVAVAHQRPDTARTCFLDDVVGTFIARGRRPAMDRVLASARPQEHFSGSGRIRHQVYPLSEDGSVFALLGRYTANDSRDSGRLGEAYQAAADDLCSMVTAGTFPLPERERETAWRVGGGLIRLDGRGVVTFASPNAMSAFRRLGAAVDLHGAVLARLAPRLNDGADGADPDLARVTSGVQAGRVELQHADVTLQLESVPLTSAGRRRGALILVRDVTELRHRERALMTKEASLREVHHRIKNNLQMVAALLRMQSRRVTSEEARGALVDAGTRVGAIAVVHEVLAASPESTVDFDDVIDRVLVMAGQLTPEAKLRREGSMGHLPTETATPMAMCLAELVANAVEHSGTEPKVNVAVRRSGQSAQVRVDDNGPGLPAGFAPQSCGRLGLQIVQTLVTENGGTVEWGNRAGGGTSAVMEFWLSLATPVRKTPVAQEESDVR